jgi:hypothetical protein
MARTQDVAKTGAKTRRGRRKLDVLDNDVLDPAKELAAWNKLILTVDVLRYFRFWNDLLQLRSGANQDAPLTKEETARFILLVRAMSWVESRHGTGADSSDRDPMQCGNPADSWWKSLCMGAGGDRLVGGPGASNYYVSQLFGALNPKLKSTPGLERADTTLLATLAKGHDDPAFNRVMSFVWAIPAVLHKTNAVSGGRKTYQCYPISRKNFEAGAQKYNGTGNANYGKTVGSVLAMLGFVDPPLVEESRKAASGPALFDFNTWNTGHLALPLKRKGARLVSFSELESAHIGQGGLTVGSMPLAFELSAGVSAVWIDIRCAAPSSLVISVEGKDGRVLYEATFDGDKQFVFATEGRKIGRLRLWANGEAVVESVRFDVAGKRGGLVQ